MRAVGSAATKSADALEPKDASALTPEKKMSLIADFIQMNRDNKLVRSSDLYSKLLSQETSLQEVYESDILKLMKQKKVTDSDIDKFIQQMSADDGLRKQLQDLKLPVPAESDTDEPSKQPEQAATQVNVPAHSLNSIQRAIKDVTDGNPKRNSLEIIQSAKNIPDDVTISGKKSSNKQKIKKAAEQTLQKAQHSLSKDGKLTQKDKKTWLDMGGIIVAEEEKLQEAIVQEIYNLLTGETK